MATPKELLSNVVRDFDVLHHAYEKAGLLGEDAGTEAAKKLLGSGEDVYRFKREFLLAEALIRNRVGRMVYGGNGLKHLAVFGGNNVGKSTVVNILAAEKVTSTSPEGGHTRHAVAISTASVQGGTRGLFGENPFAFRPFSPVHVDALDRDRLDQYGEGQFSSDTLPQDVVLWDMPDCDATDSRKYMGAVIEAVTSADAIVYVTSVERFAVEHVVEWIFILHDAGIHFLQCLNKTKRDDQPVVINDQKTRHFPAMAKRLGIAAPDPVIVGLRYLSEGEEHDLWGPSHPEAAELRKKSLQMLSQDDRNLAGLVALDFVVRRAERLLEPAQMEAVAIEQWATAVESAVSYFVAVYRQEYLEPQTVIEPFSRLNLEILNLLDPNIPGLKEFLVLARWITRWPTKLILKTGRHVYDVAFGGSQVKPEKLDPELKAYSDAHKVVLNKLGSVIDGHVREIRHHPFWEAIDAAWTAELETLCGRFGELVKQHMVETDREIKRAATEVFEKLQQRPLLLNTLRTVRVTANVGGALVGFFIPVKGGLVYDFLEELVLAPAIISTMEAATTGAVESYVRTRRMELIERLLSDARNIAAELYRKPLLRIAEVAIRTTGTLGVDKDIVQRFLPTIKHLQSQLAPRH